MDVNKDASVKVVITAIVGNFVVTLAKFAGWAMSGSASMLAEAVHSTADTLNQILLFVGIKHSQEGPSKIFPWGMGQARYVWNLVSAVGIFFIGFGVTVYHGISSLLLGHEYEGSDYLTLSILILVFAFVVEGYALLVAVRAVNIQREKMPFFEFLKQSDDPTTVGVLFEDSIAVFGVFVAITSISLSKALHSNVPDAIGSIIIGVLLGVMALFLARLNGMLLLGLSAHKSKEEEIKKFIESFSYVERIAKMKTVVLGSGQLHLAVEIEFHGEHLVNPVQIKKDADSIRRGRDPAPVLVETAERMVRIIGEKINEFERQIKTRFPDVQTIELELH